MECKISKVKLEHQDKGFAVRFRSVLNRLIWSIFYKARLLGFSVEENGRRILEVEGWLKKDGVFYVRGTLEGCENDAIYSAGEALDQAFACFTDGLRGMGVRCLKWGYLRGGGLHGVIRTAGARITGSRPHLRIHFNYPDHMTYFASLGKHARQNVRTAYNRMSRDGHVYSLSAYSWNDFGDRIQKNGRTLKECFGVYLLRHATRYHIAGLRHRLAQMARWYLADKSNFFLFCLRIDGRVAACMQGHIVDAQEIWATKLAIDDDFKFYSPGLLLVNESIRYLIEKTAFRCLNLGRGTEKYKYDMGGTELISVDYELPLQLEE